MPAMNAARQGRKCPGPRPLGAWPQLRVCWERGRVARAPVAPRRGRRPRATAGQAIRSGQRLMDGGWGATPMSMRRRHVAGGEVGARRHDAAMAATRVDGMLGSAPCTAAHLRQVGQRGGRQHMASGTTGARRDRCRRALRPFPPSSSHVEEAQDGAAAREEAPDAAADRRASAMAIYSVVGPRIRRPRRRKTRPRSDAQVPCPAARPADPVQDGAAASWWGDTGWSRQWLLLQ
ncbi:hypothetical protein ACP70R_009315 [Stipagrostis hirtigluma subsp. patula]